jgi:hypothetical protein
MSGSGSWAMAVVQANVAMTTLSTSMNIIGEYFLSILFPPRIESVDKYLTFSYELRV